MAGSGIPLDTSISAKINKVIKQIQDEKPEQKIRDATDDLLNIDGGGTIDQRFIGWLQKMLHPEVGANVNHLSNSTAAPVEANKG